MKTRTKRRVTTRFAWDRLKVSFWFAPLVMAVAAIVLSWVMYWVDVHIPNELLQNNPLVLSGSVSELRTVLITIATTTMATAGIVFTLLTLPLSTVAAQYGSRLLRVFLGDRIAQLVLGMFVATFVYCISAATSLPAESVAFEAPQLTATVGLLLMMATFATLILLVQHVSTMLQAPNIAAAAAAALLDVVRAEMLGEIKSGADKRHADQEAPDPLLETEGAAVRVRDTGYIQYIDPQYLLPLVQERDLVIRLLHKPGHFVSRGEVVALVWPAERFDKQLEGRIGHAFQIGNQRTPTQDVEYAVNQLVEMAVRAMSPAINDPFTAMTCLDYVGNGLALFIRHGERSSHYYGRDGRLRLVLEPVTFGELLSAAFDMLRHASCDNASVLLHMLTVIDTISQEAKSPGARRQLLRHVDLIQEESHAGSLIERDRQSIHLRVEALHAKLQALP